MSETLIELASRMAHLKERYKAARIAMHRCECTITREPNRNCLEELHRSLVRQKHKHPWRDTCRAVCAGRAGNAVICEACEKRAQRWLEQHNLDRRFLYAVNRVVQIGQQHNQEGE